MLPASKTLVAAVLVALVAVSASGRELQTILPKGYGYEDKLCKDLGLYDGKLDVIEKKLDILHGVGLGKLDLLHQLDLGSILGGEKKELLSKILGGDFLGKTLGLELLSLKESLLYKKFGWLQKKEVVLGKVFSSLKDGSFLGKKIDLDLLKSYDLDLLKDYDLDLTKKFGGLEKKSEVLEKALGPLKKLIPLDLKILDSKKTLLYEKYDLIKATEKLMYKKALLVNIKKAVLYKILKVDVFKVVFKKKEDLLTNILKLDLLDGIGLL